MKKIISLILILLFMVGLVACGEEKQNDAGDKKDQEQEQNKEDPKEPDEPEEPNDPEEPDEPEEPTYKLVIKNKEVTIGIGETFTIEIETDIEDSKSISYKNSDNSVVSFQKDGSLKGIKAGTVTITAKYGDITDTMTVTVTEEVKVYEKTDYRYWVNLLKDKEDVNAILMDKQAISTFNNAVYSDYSKSKVYDLSKLNTTVTGDYVKTCIERYTKITKYTMYKPSGAQVTSTEKNQVLANRNLTAIPTTVTASYGIVVNFNSMKAYPTNNYLSTANYDYNQETGLVVGEAVLIYHYSLDNEWCFVQAENYNGWMPTKDVAKCTAEQFNTFYRYNNYMVVIGERINIDGTILRMGDKLPLKSTTDTEMTILMPKKCADDTLCVNEVTIQKNENVNEGYLDFTYTNLYKQGFKLLDTAYRWGDYAIDGRDCSSTMNAIYHCFGFVMPRNTSNQNVIPGYSTVVSGLNNTSMKNYKIGTMIFTSSHVMMYIGEDENGVCYLLHNSGKCKLQSLSDYISSGKTMIATLTIR